MTRIRLHPSGRLVEVGAGATVLESLEKAGYALPNNCRAGACGECKVKVLEGRFDQGFVMDMALAPDERRQGYGLMCMAKPLSDELVIEWGTADAKPKLFPPREGQRFVVTDRIVRTPRIVELRLRPLRDAMRYWPGQYLMLGDPAAGVPLRSYSIANAPRNDGELAVQITRAADGLTSAWAHDTLLPGTRVAVNGPYGTFIGDPSVDTPVLCMAAGSGLAPILALTEAALRRSYADPVTLLFSAATADELYDRGLMAWWEARHRNFRYRPTLTRATPADARALHGRIPALLPTLFSDLARHSVFVAGSPAFVDDCVAAAKSLGAQPGRIHTEGYFPQSPPQTPPAGQLLVQRQAP
ncbi:MAG: 2Fe-2S iron-sulfur cluster binding domain-containing protein [Burkholderiales bacterium]|nr:2Fe-2S iron-sulfur cluster binding domain-containing protein [Burkholderiales bacterium]MDE1927455.1 2Fe-2S iron-sulfur cluster binding domain-containing protein [Burkholderiales bacterium]MDE2157628.1 2Fe-2S iron-sulfur cluster binding domain-containing protein [Burkholderiales bacterium]MDE2503650.1 2Fe-2S iron-sulfur cluster binding domain-containing protein [Burkholderiales bacterium]